MGDNVRTTWLLVKQVFAVAFNTDTVADRDQPLSQPSKSHVHFFPCLNNTYTLSFNTEFMEIQDLV